MTCAVAARHPADLVLRSPRQERLVHPAIPGQFAFAQPRDAYFSVEGQKDYQGESVFQFRAPLHHGTGDYGRRHSFQIFEEKGDSLSRLTLLLKWWLGSQPVVVVRIKELEARVLRKGATQCRRS